MKMFDLDQRIKALRDEIGLAEGELADLRSQFTALRTEIETLKGSFDKHEKDPEKHYKPKGAK